MKSVIRALSRPVLAAAFAAGLALGTPAAAQAPKAPKKVTIAVGTQVLNITYPWLLMPVALEWWKKEGIEVNVIAAAGSLQAVQLMAAGNADFVQINSSIVIQANVNNGIPVRTIMQNGVIDWSMTALEDGPIKTVADIRGKAIGVFSLASGGVPFLKAYLRANKIDPDKDVQLIPVGAGAPALEALRSNRVQALMFWAAMNTTFENQGVKLRHFRGADWKTFPDFTLATHQRVIDRDPALVEAIGRGAAMASEFTLAQGGAECVRRIQWKHWPDTRPSGAPDEATRIRWDLNNLKAQTDTMRDAYEQNGGKLWGATTPQTYNKMQTFMREAELIKRTIPATEFVVGIPGYFEKINRFDRKAMQALAARCPVQ